jgi:hypothetical protein
MTYLAAKVGDASAWRRRMPRDWCARERKAACVPLRPDSAHAQYPPFAPADRPCGPLRGRQGAVKERIMQAYFEEGVRYRRPRGAGTAGCRSGLSRARHPGCAHGAARGSGRGGRRRAPCRVLGITGVPTFIFDGQYTISGAQEPANLAQVFDQVAEFAAAREAPREFPPN